jgi:hypothetical protein
MIRVQVEPSKNRIDLKVDQQVNEADMRRIVQELAAGVKSMQPGWIMVSDFRGLTMVDPDLNSYIVEIQKTVRSASPRKIAVLFDDDVLHFQLRMGANTSGSHDITQRFTDEQEWLAFIDEP